MDENSSTVEKTKYFFLLCFLALMPFISGLLENPWIINDRAHQESTHVSQVMVNAERRVSSVLEGLAQDGQNGQQFFRHVAFFRGQTIFEMWQYRPLTEILIEGIGRILLKIRFPYPFLTTIFLLRLGIAVLSLHLLYRYLGFFLKNNIGRCLLLCVYTYAALFSNFWSDLSLSTHLEVCFYLLAGIYAFLPYSRIRLYLLIILAVTNRETAIFIPLLVLFSGVGEAKVNASVSFLLACLTYVLLRVGIYREIEGTFETTTLPHFLSYNLSEFYPLLNFLKVMLPLAVLILCAGWRSRIQSDFLRKTLFIFCPLWILSHFVCANAAEARLFLVPLAVAVLPCFAASMEQNFANKSTIK